MNVIVAGSRAIPPGNVGRWIVEFLGKLPPDTTILLRKGMVTEAGKFEQMVAMVCDLMGLEVEWRQVEKQQEPWRSLETGEILEPTKTGRQLVFDRDLKMAADCDFAVCVTMPDQAFDLECGTTALAQKVLEADHAVYHYALFQKLIPAFWHLVRVGEHDPDGKFARYVSD